MKFVEGSKEDLDNFKEALGDFLDSCTREQRAQLVKELRGE